MKWPRLVIKKNLVYNFLELTIHKEECLIRVDKPFLRLPRLLKGELIERPNRFLGIVQLESGEKIRSFVADPGRLTELLYPGVEVYVTHISKEGRKTEYDLCLVRNKHNLISVDSRVPNKLMKVALTTKKLQPFEEYESIHTEPAIKKGRLDFLLTGENLSPCYLEVKSCTLVINKTAMFPDAPTIRGSRHLGELIELKKEGFRSCIVFIIQHPDAKFFVPNDKTDPLFAKEFYRALNSGVEVYPYNCKITSEGISINELIPIKNKT